MPTGWIYVASNPNYGGLVKIGRTDRDPEIRMGELNTTGLADPFSVEFQCLVEDPVQVEKLTHEHFSDSRHREDREFFNVSAHAVAGFLSTNFNLLFSKQGNDLCLDESQRIYLQRDFNEVIDALTSIDASEIERAVQSSRSRVISGVLAEQGQKYLSLNPSELKAKIIKDLMGFHDDWGRLHVGFALKMPSFGRRYRDLNYVKQLSTIGVTTGLSESEALQSILAESTAYSAQEHGEPIIFDDRALNELSDFLTSWASHVDRVEKHLVATLPPPRETYGTIFSRLWATGWYFPLEKNSETQPQLKVLTRLGERARWYPFSFFSAAMSIQSDLERRLGRFQKLLASERDKLRILLICVGQHDLASIVQQLDLENYDSLENV